jgi:hypothetical protein
VATFRDDLANAGRRLLETVEERTGREVITSEERQLLESDRSERRRLERTLDFIGFSLWNYDPGTAGMPGHPGGFELKPQMRRFIAQQARTAWVEDPMLGNSVELYLSFVFGRGVPRPQAHDPEVQKHLDATWNDKSNQRVLTSYDRLLEKGVDLCHQANVFFKFFDGTQPELGAGGEDGIVRVSLERFDDVEDVVRHDELAAAGRGDRFRILYYRSKERTVRFDFAQGSRTAIGNESDPTGTPKTVYFEAWGAFDDDDPVQSQQDDGLRQPPAHMMRPGKIVHLAVNKTSEMAFGVPRMQRYINWASAYNEMLVSFRDRMRAMASVYMKATAKGGQRDLNRLAQMATGRPSLVGGSRDVEPDGRAPAPRGTPGILGENESLSYEPFKIDSTAGDVAAAAPVLRGQLGGPWPDSYLSGFAQGAIAGAQSLELPTLKFVEREQELWVLGILRPLGEASVAKAVEKGYISEWREPTQSELEQVQAADEAGEPLPFEANTEGQIKRDLSFEIALPNPLKRAMLDIVSAAQQTATMVDPNGENHELSRWLFATVLAEAFDVSDPMRIVDQVLPRQPKKTPAEEAEEQGLDPETGLPIEGAIGPDGKRHTADNASGAPVKAPNAEQRKVREAAVVDLATDLLTSLAANGNGSHG